MPWSAKDADSHKKGLTEAQKIKWASIANAVLKECQSKGESDCEGKAIRVANSSFSQTGLSETVPSRACTFSIDKEAIEFRENPDTKEPVLDMTCYSGKIIEGHWYWGDLAIDLSGMKFRKHKYPILEDHYERIGFMNRPSITSDFKLMADPNAKFLENDRARQFLSDARAGFPFEASISAKPTKIQRLMEKEEAEVNGFTMKGPGTIWRECDFREVSVCVFGWDRNSSTKVFSDSGNEEYNVEVMTIQEGDVTKPTEQLEGGVKTMNLEELKKEHPQLVQEIIKETEIQLAASFAKEKKDLENSFSEKLDTVTERMQQIETRNLQLEKSEAIRAANERAAIADAIWATKLSKSTVPEDLYEKVKAQISFTKFVKEDVLDETAFSAAIDEEIKDWETKISSLSSSKVLGFSPKGKSQTPAPVTDPDEWTLTEDDEARVKRNLSLLGIEPQGSA